MNEKTIDHYLEKLNEVGYTENGGTVVTWSDLVAWDLARESTERCVRYLFEKVGLLRSKIILSRGRRIAELEAERDDARRKFCQVLAVCNFTSPALEAKISEWSYLYDDEAKGDPE